MNDFLQGLKQTLGRRSTRIAALLLLLMIGWEIYQAGDSETAVSPAPSALSR